MRATLPVVCLLATASAAVCQLPSDGRASYARDPNIRLKFELQADRPAERVDLYYTYEGGAWQKYDSVRNGQKKEFIFKADRDGQYEFATMTVYRDGSSDPASKAQLSPQKRTIVDRTRPKILSVRSTVNADGSPGLEWDVADDHLKPKGIELMYKWPEANQYQPIDVGVPFSARDHRHWQLPPNERMQVKLVATDWAGNRAESDPVWVSAKDGVKNADVVRDPRPSGSGASSVRDSEVAPAGGGARAQVPLYYVNRKVVTINTTVSVGPSGIQDATLYYADEKLAQWVKTPGIGAKAAPPTNDPDKLAKIPLQFVFDVKQDGLYNVIVLVKTHLGLSGREPVRGDPGHLQVIVDETKPTVELLGTKVAPNGDRGAVVNITWRAQDANIAPIPIKLEYRAAKSEEWKGVTPAEWVDNTGQHTWTPPTGDAHEFFIRVACKDRAGNEHQVTSPTPVNVDLVRPQVEYGDVAPGRGGAGGGGGDRNTIPDPPGMGAYEVLPGPPTGPTPKVVAPPPMGKKN